MYCYKIRGKKWCLPHQLCGPSKWTLLVSNTLSPIQKSLPVSAWCVGLEFIIANTTSHRWCTNSILIENGSNKTKNNLNTAPKHQSIFQKPNTNSYLIIFELDSLFEKNHKHNQTTHLNSNIITQNFHQITHLNLTYFLETVTAMMGSIGRDGHESTFFFGNF